MKVCPNCNNTVEDNAIFCDKCGTRFAAQNNAQNGYYQQPYQPSPQKQPKKKNTGLIIGIIAAVLIVLAIIGSVAEKAFQNQGYGSSGGNNNPSYNFGEIGNNSSNNNNTGNDQNSDENSTTENDNANDTAVYNKGTFADGVYINDWANMRYDAGTIWTNGSADEYASYEGDPNTDCGVILNDATNGKQLAICFEKLTGTNVLINEDTYLDVVAGGLKDQYTSLNLTCETSEYFDTTIAGERFRTVRITFDGTTMVQDFHVRKLDNFIICVAVTAQDSFDAATTVNNIRAID